MECQFVLLLCEITSHRIVNRDVGLFLSPFDAVFPTLQSKFILHLCLKQFLSTSHATVKEILVLLFHI